MSGPTPEEQAAAFQAAWQEVSPYLTDLHPDCEQCQGKLVEIFEAMRAEEVGSRR